MQALTLILEEQIGQQVGSLEKNDISSDILQNSLCVQSENRHRLLNVKCAASLQDFDILSSSDTIINIHKHSCIFLSIMLDIY